MANDQPNQPEKPRTIIPRPEVVAAVAKWPPLTPTQKATLRRALSGPGGADLIEARIRARHPELDLGDGTNSAA